MSPNFKLSSGSYKVWKFPSGEIGLQLDRKFGFHDFPLTITGSILSSDHLMELLQLNEAFNFDGIQDIKFIMPYCAYSRQDRRCNPGESFSLKVFADLINSCNFSSVITYDNHSDVSTALINNCTNIHVKNILDTKYIGKLVPNTNYYNYLISPDAGANKKVFDCSKTFNIPMIRADKVRDTSTGNIIETQVFATANQLKDKVVLIIDDIMAGGRTFEELAKAIKAIEPSCEIHLYTTHMFAHNGLSTLYEAGIDKFITTDSVIGDHSITAARALETKMHQKLLTVLSI